MKWTLAHGSAGISHMWCNRYADAPSFWNRSHRSKNSEYSAVILVRLCDHSIGSVYCSSWSSSVLRSFETAAKTIAPWKKVLTSVQQTLERGVVNVYPTRQRIFKFTDMQVIFFFFQTKLGNFHYIAPYSAIKCREVNNFFPY